MVYQAYFAVKYSPTHNADTPWPPTHNGHGQGCKSHKPQGKGCTFTRHLAQQEGVFPLGWVQGGCQGCQLLWGDTELAPRAVLRASECFCAPPSQPGQGVMGQWEKNGKGGGKRCSASAEPELTAECSRGRLCTQVYL